MVRDTTLYDRLELSTNASLEEIEKKGRKLLIKWHPDKNPNNIEESTKKFQEIQEALNILKDGEKRELYDRFGFEGANNGAPDMGGFNPFGGFPFPGNPFGNFHQHQHERKEKENINTTLEVTLEQIYNEEVVQLKYNQKNCCNKCSGEGTCDGSKSTCKECKGMGKKIQTIRMGPMIQQSQVQCNICYGKGTYIPDNNKCHTCTGSGYTMKEKIAPITLKNGMGNGIKLHMEGHGHHFRNMKTDLIVVIKEIPHNIFTRHGSDLHITIELKLYQGLFGFDKKITHLDGRKLHLHHTGKTIPETTKQINGEGMNDLRTKNKGNLVILFKWHIPTIDPTAKNNEIFTKFLKLFDKDETVIEKEIQDDTTLIKTILSEHHSQQQQYNNNTSDDEDQQHQGGPQCVQQ